jgi:hypothetical protein
MKKSNICLICSKSFPIKGPSCIKNHIIKIHNISYKEYYDKFYKSKDEGICKICGKESLFVNNKYTSFCSKQCHNLFKSKLSKARWKNNKNYANKMINILKDNIIKSFSNPIAIENRKNAFNKVLKDLWSNEEFINRHKERSSIIASKMNKDPQSKFGYIKNKKMMYKEVLMKSSWEVNFAKQCDLKNISWVYEPKTFKLSYGFKLNFNRIRYTPDFYLPDYDLFVEIKPISMGCFNDLYTNLVIEMLFNHDSKLVLVDKELSNNLISDLYGL